MRPPRRTHPVGKKPLRLPQLRLSMPIGGYYRLSLVLDHGSFRELDADLAPQDVLHFPGYREKLAAAQNKTGLREAAVTATGRMAGSLRGCRAGQPLFSWAAWHRRGRQDHPRHRVRRRKAPAAGYFFRPAAARGCRRAFSA